MLVKVLLYLKNNSRKNLNQTHKPRFYFNDQDIILNNNGKNLFSQTIILFFFFFATLQECKYLGPAMDCPVVGVKFCNICVFFDKIFVICGTMCIIYNKVTFITNIIYVTEIQTFNFYNNRHTFTIMNITFTTNTHILPKSTPVP